MATQKNRARLDPQLTQGECASSIVQKSDKLVLRFGMEKLDAAAATQEDICLDQHVFVVIDFIEWPGVEDAHAARGILKKESHRCRNVLWFPAGCLFLRFVFNECCYPLAV